MITVNYASCSVCGASLPPPHICFGKQPPSNRFMLDSASAIQLESFDLSLSVCTHCGTVQLFDRMPIDVFRPRFDWLIYNEPEAHLDDVASHLADLPGLRSSSRFMGITYKDQSTLTRMSNLGFPDTVCLKDSDIECTSVPFGLETVQDALSNPINVSKVKTHYGQTDVLLVRHIVEHAFSASKLLNSLKALVKPGGYMMLELPDSQNTFNESNYPFIWEEHISYFTETTAMQLAHQVNAKVAWLGRYEYPYEDSLNVVLNFPADTSITYNSSKPDPLLNWNSHFFKNFAKVRDKWHYELQVIRSKGDKIAVFGAGHLAVKFINFFELSDVITCVIDDHPKKVGKYMPGSGLPIVSTAQLTDMDIRYCVSTLSPESEVKVRKKLTEFFDTGGIFIPAFNTV